jgi:hypothetical protein
VRLELAGLAGTTRVTVLGAIVTVLAALVMVVVMIRVTVAGDADWLMVLVLMRTDT